jgi:flagellar biosynthesis protein FlhF
VEQLTMSTLTFQDYVRERMLKRRQAEMAQPEQAAATEPAAPRAAAPVRRAPPVLRDEIRYEQPVFDEAPAAARADQDSQRRDQNMLEELRSMKGLIEERFGALAFMEKLQRSPRQANLTQKLLDCGFSPALIRKLGESLPSDCTDETAWAAGVLERNLSAADHEPALEDVGGVYALIGSTGVGKTTTTAKIAAAFATKHGAGNLGLITLDAYRVAAHEQLRTYGRILGVPVHTAHDRASLEDLLELLSAKKMVLIDTAGMAQRDARCRELLDMLSHRAIQKLLVVNAAAQGETIEDVMISYRAGACRGVVLSKMDEAVKLGPALDALIRHKLKIVGVANGQRVPEDWHRLSAQALVQRALRASPAPSWRVDADDVNLVFAGLQKPAPRRATPARAA